MKNEREDEVFQLDEELPAFHQQKRGYHNYLNKFYTENEIAKWGRYTVRRKLLFFDEKSCKLFIADDSDETEDQEKKLKLDSKQ